MSTARNFDNYTRYITLIAKNKYPNLDIGGDALNKLNIVIKDLAKRLITIAIAIAKHNNNKTITIKHMAFAVDFLMIGKLIEQSRQYSIDALKKYESSKDRNTAKRSGLTFSPSRIESTISNTAIGYKKAFASSVYLAATLELITSKLIELMGEYTKSQKKARMNIDDLNKAIQNDKNLQKVLKY